MRTNQWLSERLSHLHRTYFTDIEIKNAVLVKFGRKSKGRLGSIIARPAKGFTLPVTYITINSLFKDEIVPDYVIEATLAHEFVHYSHGFHSPLERKYKFPHKGDIVNKDIRARGMGELLDRQNVWLKKEYTQFLKRNKML